MSDNKKIMSMGLVVLCILLYPLLSEYLLYINERDFDAWKHRASAAADAAEMLEFMQRYKSNLESAELTEGHFTLIFVTPENDYALHHRSVNRLVDRLVKLQDIDPLSVAYQKSLDDLRGTIQGLEDIAEGKTEVELLWWWFAWIFLVLGAVAVLLYVDVK